jgi:short-subunit dehydrogenase
VAWQAKRAIVVGASSGIGEAVAMQLAKSGAEVALVARRQEELERVASAIRAAGGKARVYLHDAARSAEAAPLLDQISTALGGLDCLVYASGAMPEVGEGEFDFEKDRQMIEVNLLGAIAWCGPAAVRFAAQRSGTVIGISSIAGERGRRGNPGYCTSKGAFTIWLESMRNRYAREGVNVVTIKPGFVDTAMTKGKPGLFWLVSAADAARMSLALAAKENSASGFVPGRWALVAFVVRNIPSFVFRKLNF